jgi:hypothetical protein
MPSRWVLCLAKVVSLSSSIRHPNFSHKTPTDGAGRRVCLLSRDPRLLKQDGCCSSNAPARDLTIEGPKEYLLTNRIYPASEPGLKPVPR